MSRASRMLSPLALITILARETPRDPDFIQSPVYPLVIKEAVRAHEALTSFLAVAQKDPEML